jgi:hypothetical protein
VQDNRFVAVPEVDDPQAVRLSSLPPLSERDAGHQGAGLRHSQRRGRSAGEADGSRGV